jgi:sialate O-acetylesterase
MRNILFVICFLAVCNATSARVQLPSFISSDMILQQKSKVPLWGGCDANKKVTITTSWNKKTYSTTGDNNGRWKILVATPAAGGPFTINFSDGDVTTLSNVLIGEVWFASGQSNMEMRMTGMPKAKVKNAETIISASENKNIRLFTVNRADSPTPQDSCVGKWNEAKPEVVKTFSAVAYQYAKMLNDRLNVPIGIISSSWGGTPIEAWMSTESLKDVMDSKPVDASFQKRRTGLYNAMIHPLEGYGIKGFLWYQGEANRNNSEVYAALMAAMVRDWRNKWNDKDLAFYFVQIAPLGGDTKRKGLGFLREAQVQALQLIPNSGMAVSIDAGEEENIHPADKTIIAHRLALLALAKNYGFKNVAYSGPVFRKMKLENKTAELYFDFAENGLTDNGKGLQLFEIAGDDKVFYPAEAVIMNNKIIVTSKMVNKPVAVRYAFKDWVTGDLFNKDGLPASSFRTDKW